MQSERVVDPGSARKFEKLANRSGFGFKTNRDGSLTHRGRPKDLSTSLGIVKQEHRTSSNQQFPIALSFPLLDDPIKQIRLLNCKPKILESSQGRKIAVPNRNLGQQNPYKSLEKIYTTKKKPLALTYSNWTKNFDMLGSSR